MDEPNLADLQKQVDDLKEQIEQLKVKRIYQQDLINSAVKSRHLGEGNRYFLAGLDANRPTGVSVTSSVSCYFATDTKKLYLWTGTAYVSVTLS